MTLHSASWYLYVYLLYTFVALSTTQHFVTSLYRIKTHADIFGLLLKERLPELGLHLVSLT